MRSLFATLLLARAESHAGAHFRQTLRHLAPQPDGASGNQGHAAVEIEELSNISRSLLRVRVINWHDRPRKGYFCCAVGGGMAPLSHGDLSSVRHSSSAGPGASSQPESRCSNCAKVVTRSARRL